MQGESDVSARDDDDNFIIDDDDDDDVETRSKLRYIQIYLMIIRNHGLNCCC